MQTWVKLAVVGSTAIGITLNPASVRGFSPLTDSTDVRLSDFEETTNSVFVSHLDPNVVFVANNRFDPLMPNAVAGWISTDGGRSWTGTGPVAAFNHPSAVISDFVEPGSEPYGRFLLAHNGNTVTNENGQDVSFRDTPTEPWTTVTVYYCGGLCDVAAFKPHLWVDNLSQPWGGTRLLYDGWTSYAEEAPQITIHRSLNNGADWVNKSPTQFFQDGQIEEKWGVNIHTNVSGSVYAVWANNRDVGLNQAKSIGFTASENEGETWTDELIIATVTGFNKNFGLRSDNSMPVTTYPSMTVDDNGTIYVVWASHEGSHPASSYSDIYFVKGLPTGETSFIWSPEPRRVNPVSTGDQWHPWITWDRCSRSLAVVYYSSRSDNSRAETWVAVSGDTAYTWQEIKLSDTSGSGDWDFASGIEYIGMAADDGRAYAVWSDDRDLGLDYRPYASPFYLWGVNQSSISSTVVGGLSSLTVTVAWTTNLAAATPDGDELVLTDPVGRLHSVVGTSQDGLSHSLSKVVPCEPGWWTYTVYSSRIGCDSRRASDAKKFFANCIE